MKMVKSVWVAGALAAPMSLPLSVYAQDDFGMDYADEEKAPLLTQRELDYDSTVEWLVTYKNKNNAYFDRIAFGEDGFDTALNLDIVRRSPHDGTDARYWLVEGEDIGMSTGGVALEYGVQGRYKAWFSYDLMDMVYLEGAVTPFQLSDNVATLPADWWADPAQNNAADLSNYSETDLEVERETTALGYSLNLDKHWTISMDYSRQRKKGEQAIGAGQGFSGAQLVPYSIDYTHDQFSMILGYGKDKLHWQLEYELSLLDNDDDVLTFENATWSQGSEQVQQMALAPSNSMQRLTFTGGYNFTNRTRATLNLSYSQAKQDESFLPYSFSNFYDELLPPGQSLMDRALLPQSDLDGKYDVLMAKLQLTSRPSKNLNLKASYKYQEKDNKTSKQLLTFLSYSNAAGRSEFDDGWANRVYGRKQHQLELEAGYRLPHRMKLRTGLDYDRDERENAKFAAVQNFSSNTLTTYSNETDEARLWAELKLPHSGRFSAKLKASIADRNADLDNEYQHHIIDHAEAFPYFLTDRDQSRVGLQATYSFSEQLMLMASADKRQEDFDDAIYGLQWRDSDTVNLDLSYTPTDSLAMNVYFGFSQSKYEQDSRTGGGNNVLWSYNINDENYMAGFTLDWVVIENLIDLNLDYYYSESIVTIREFDSTGAVDKMPDNTERTNRVSLGVNWYVRQDFTVSANYLFDRRRSENWAWDGSAYIGNYAFGWDEPTYDAHFMSLSVSYHF